ncbi:hypothetical protein HMPREF1502_0034 [Klebsiella sp. AS10]|nr:hypothetical protein HMPREF1502_0034 [Klebsiella sp. AS10]
MSGLSKNAAKRLKNHHLEKKIEKRLVQKNGIPIMRSH